MSGEFENNHFSVAGFNIKGFVDTYIEPAGGASESFLDGAQNTEEARTEGEVADNRAFAPFAEQGRQVTAPTFTIPRHSGGGSVPNFGGGGPPVDLDVPLAERESENQGGTATDKADPDLPPEIATGFQQRSFDAQTNYFIEPFLFFEPTQDENVTFYETEGIGYLGFIKDYHNDEDNLEYYQNLFEHEEVSFSESVDTIVYDALEKEKLVEIFGNFDIIGQATTANEMIEELYSLVENEPVQETNTLYSNKFTTEREIKLSSF